jgi:hypothetical protein
MIERHVGLTELLNMVNDYHERSQGVSELREVTVSLDEVVLRCFGWVDLDASREHRTTDVGLRYVMPEESRIAMLNRLLELNHQRYAEEVDAGLHDSKAKKPRTKRSPKKASEDQGELL